MARRKTNASDSHDSTAADKTASKTTTSKTAGRTMPTNPRRGPVWMVPTGDGGRVPEGEARR